MNVSLPAATTDIELASKPPAPRRLDGYPSFADFVARDGDAAIYRKFKHLSARNLLYLQSELHALEERLEVLDAEDAARRDELGDEDGLARHDGQKAAREWRYMCDDANPRARLHRELQGQIRAKLKEYHEALVLESKVLAFRQPDSRTLSAFRKWFSTKIPVLWGRDKSLYDVDNDLAALSPVETDRLNFLLQRYFGWLFKQEYAEGSQAHSRGSGMFYYPHDRIQIAGAVLSVLFSAVLLVGAIVCLLSTSNSSRSMQIGMIVLFTCIFALVVGLLTNARRAEIFGATAAYAAVLVVFISNNLNGVAPTSSNS